MSKQIKLLIKGSFLICNDQLFKIELEGFTGAERHA